jgi:hypothetical protein
VEESRKRLVTAVSIGDALTAATSAVGSNTTDNAPTASGSTAADTTSSAALPTSCGASLGKVGF